MFSAAITEQSLMPFRSLLSWSPSKSSRPARDVIAALALKGVLLGAVYLLFFGPAHRPPSDATATATALIGTASPQDAP